MHLRWRPERTLWSSRSTTKTILDDGSRFCTSTTRRVGGAIYRMLFPANDRDKQQIVILAKNKGFRITVQGHAVGGYQ